MKDTPALSANHREELVVDFRLLHCIPRLKLFFLILLVKLDACIFEFCDGASLSKNVA